MIVLQYLLQRTNAFERRRIMNWPPLTTVRIPYLTIGYEGARQVHRLIRGLSLLVNDEVTEKIKGELVVRKTTGPARSELSL